MVKKRNKYTAEFKQEAVGLVMEHGYSYADAGRSLGVHGNMISRWKRELEVQGKHAYPGNGRLTPDSSVFMSWRKRIAVYRWSVIF